MQLSFDAIFNQIFTHRQEPDNKVMVGDTVSLMNKITFEHEFHVVLNTDIDYMQTTLKGACQLTKGSKRTELHGLTALPLGVGYENESFAVVKTDRRNPSAEWIRAGLLTE